MDVHSVEFYVIAFVVAMALLTLLMGQRERGPATTQIDALTLLPARSEQSGRLAMSSADLEHVTISRSGIPLFEGDTVNLISTIVDGKWHIVEKRGVAGHGAATSMDGLLEVAWLKPGRYHVRYDSEITGQWCTFAYTHRPGNSTQQELKY
ncbi:MAG: hypothetical protein IJ808_02545 [Muribaculaceae bacterium]|nr:hypothetical protein [Muribaculaceae bacterium]